MQPGAAQLGFVQAQNTFFLWARIMQLSFRSLRCTA